MNPSHIAHRHLESILSHLPGTLDGDVESVHQARIATRRLREVIPLVGDDVLPHTADTVRRAGKQLGRVRDLDVMSELLDSLGSRLPAAVAAAEWHDARHAVHERQRSARRRMVKALERLDLESLRGGFPAGSWRMTRWLTPFWNAPWTESLWSRIISRAEAAVAAIHRAPAVYFPNRTHSARIAVKKLRYSIELAADTGIWRHDRVLKDLRRLQNVLGGIHDAQVLMDELDGLVHRSEPTTPRTSFLKATLASDIERQHAQYAKRRGQVDGIAAACAHAYGDARHRRQFRAPLVAASVIAAPAIVPWARRRLSIHS
jgi:CHAD domain-containing protein